jgi:hypothetical protein
MGLDVGRGYFVEFIGLLEYSGFFSFGPPAWPNDHLARLVGVFLFLSE